MQTLRDIRSRDDVDMIIALGMAKEGFDWIWCEHALTVGYRGSLTEVFQIIGRATRDAPGKGHAQFTNLIAEPDASQERVTDAVNNMLKAIACSLLMEQVLAPNFKFKTKPIRMNWTAHVEKLISSTRRKITSLPFAALPNPRRTARANPRKRLERLVMLRFFRTKRCCAPR